MNAPKLRFNEFSDEWNKTKLSEITSAIGDGLHSTPCYDDNGGYYFANGSNIQNGKLEFDESTKTINFEEFSKYGNKLSENSILVSLNGATWGRFGLYNGEKIMLGKSLGYINVLDKVSKDFIYYILQTKKIRRFFESVTTGSTIKNLSLHTLRNTELKIPSIIEQNKIADFFILLNQKIQIQQEKIDLLKEQKKGYIQKIFSHELRFRDENGQLLSEWNAIPLSEFSNFLTGENKNDFIEEKGNFLIMDMGSVSTEGRIIASKKTNANNDLLQKGDLIMPKDDIGGGKIIGLTAYINRNNKYVLGDHVYLIKMNINICNPLFAHYQFQSQYFRKKLKRLVTGSAQLGITSNNIMKEPFYIPSLEEQNKIAYFLSLVDKKIIIEEKRLNLLMSKKQAFMQKMFI